eukprot:TRINITY_DN1491_c0_g1_i1.p2 TRINITY_DN1491_c0_g1~~TRINITY_DN1491_c0_g1_i1.p2  ORF type:complete len:170 (+),score=48.08 TRINITY_DN1491_c0_g1_i1:62-511(+)
MGNMGAGNMGGGNMPGGNMGGCNMGGGMASGMSGMDGGMAGQGGMGGGGNMGNMSNGGDLVMQVLQEMPDMVSGDPRGVALRSAVPSEMVEQLQARAANIQRSTNTTISFKGDPSARVRSMEIQGPLNNTCAAFMLMIRCFIEIESGGN